LTLHKWFSETYRDKLGKRADTTWNALSEFVTYGGNLIVETGCARQDNDWGAGLSTVIFADFCQRFNKTLISIDNDLGHIRMARRLLQKYLGSERCTAFILGRGEDVLSSLSSDIGLLYLDSCDFDAGQRRESQRVCADEFQAARPLLGKHSVVLIDDCDLEMGGKGGIAVSDAAELGWKTILSDYQLLLGQSE
jgi:hypothetical protein